MTVWLYEDYLRVVPDWPKPGVTFRDIGPLLENWDVFGEFVEDLSQLVPFGTEYLVAVESRGFILASALAFKLDMGLVMARKQGKLPVVTATAQFKSEYGEEEQLELGADLPIGWKACLVDDVLATGSTLIAAHKLVNRAYGQVLGVLTGFELNALGGRARLEEHCLVGNFGISVEVAEVQSLCSLD